MTLLHGNSIVSDTEMSFKGFIIRLAIVCTFAILPVHAQNTAGSGSEYADDGTPVLIKNLPDPEEVRAKAVWAKSIAEVEGVVGEQPILDLLELAPGIEAAVAVYPEGKLLLVEYPTPQLSIDADEKFQSRLNELGLTSSIAYRRIGNYSAFVFNGSDPKAANALLDQIKYIKTVQWLGEDPNYQRKVERYFAGTTADIFISTLIFVVVGAGIALGIGAGAGYLLFRREEKRRHARQAFTDAGGMTRLNLDEFSGD